MIPSWFPFDKVGPLLVSINDWLLGKNVIDEISKSGRAKWAFRALRSFAAIGVTSLIASGVVGLISYCGGRDTTEFGFETQSDVWTTPQPQDKQRGFALSSPGITTVYFIKGKSSMVVRVDLDGSDKGRAANLHQGEVFVDMRFVRPRSLANELVLTSVDLYDKTIKGGIYIAPTLVGKDPSHPPFIQVFLESCNTSMTRVPLEPFVKVTGGGLRGFSARATREDMKKMKDICGFGIKLGLNPEDRNEYHGEIHIDAIDW